MAQTDSPSPPKNEPRPVTVRLATSARLQTCTWRWVAQTDANAAKPVQNMPTTHSPLYLTDSAAIEPAKPLGSTDLTALFGLEALASSVARFDPQTHEKRKLRKSYKNQISDLPGKHDIPKSQLPSLLEIVSQPPKWNPLAPPLLKPLDERTMDTAFNLDITPQSGIPGFDVAQLALPTGSVSSPGQLSPAANSAEGGGFRAHVASLAYDSNVESSNDESTGTKRKKRRKTLESENTRKIQRKR